jgi:lethal(2) giant larvae protein
MGTKNGDIRIYGAPGTAQQQLACYQDIHPFPILRLLFVQGQSQLITLTERVYRNEQTNKGESQLYLVLWQIPNYLQHDLSTPTANNHVEKIKEYALDPKIVNGTRLSALTLLNDSSHLFLGFETGDIYVFNVSSFQIVPGVINKDYILKNLPDLATGPSSSSDGHQQGQHKKLTQLGAVESICHHPRQLTKLLLAYQRGLWVIFDFIKNQIDQINQTQHQLESAVFYQAGECVATSHSDGSFILWDLESGTNLAQSSSGTPAANSSPPNIVYGPYPCKAVTKCMVKTCRSDQPYVIFSGGCPRVNYSDKITISVIQGENSHVCFDFTSKIIDFYTIDKPFIEKQAVNPLLNSTSSGHNLSPQQTTTITYDNPQALFVLLEEEFVAIDLVSQGWPQYRLPYLYSVHSSAIICTHYVNGVSQAFYDRLKQFGELAQDPSEFYSQKDWPIVTPPQTSAKNSPVGSNTKSAASETKDLLLTGHEDGSVRFWDVTLQSMTLLYRLRTSDYFQTDSTPIDESNAHDRATNINNSSSSAVSADNWPPFRKVGTFDPYSDDPKLGIQKIFLCPQRHVLVVAGTAGQVLIMSINENAKEVQFGAIQSHKINIIGVSPEVESHFVWKGHEPLSLRGRLTNNFNSSSNGSASNTNIINGSLKLTAGFQLHSLIQLYPPATISALTLNTDWQLVGMGTSYGFALFDFLHTRDLLIRCTLDPAQLLSQSPNDSGSHNNNNNNTGTTISRRKSLKKSLRESFRKLRRGRSQKPAQSNGAVATTRNKTMLLNNNTSQMRVEHLDDDMLGGGDHKPIERQVESREFKASDDIPPSVIRYMYFVRTFITSSHQQTNSLWVGTNTGVIYIYALQFLNGQTQLQNHMQSLKNTTTPCQVRTNQSINCLLAKEMRLKHRAPVVHIQVIDQQMQPLPNDHTTPTATLTTDSLTPQNHKVIICSEEQFKVFQLPTLKPVCKFKLTAVEGARVRRIGYNKYTSRTDPRYSEYCLSCLSNLGDLSVYNLPQLKRQVQIQCMKQQDINAITSFVFSKQGQAFYLQSPSEFVHISMSARDSPQPQLLSAPSGSASKRNSLTNSQSKPQTKQQQPPTTQSQQNTKTKTPNDTNSQSPSDATNSSGATGHPVPAPRTTINSNNTTQLSNDMNTSTTSQNIVVTPANRSTLKPDSKIATTPTTTSTATATTTTTPATHIAPTTTTATTSMPINAVSPVSNTGNIDESSTTISIKASDTTEIISDLLPYSNSNTTTTTPTSALSPSNDTSFMNTTLPNSQNQSNQSNVTTNSITSNHLNQQTTSLQQSTTATTTTTTSSSAAAATVSTVTATSANFTLINASSITSQSDVSFNVSSSGYNGSSIITSSNFGVDLSMDSVVDRFHDDFDTRRQYPLANNDESQACNDSILNESSISEFSNKLSLQHTNNHHATTNGHSHKNGQVNLTFDIDFKPETTTTTTTTTNVPKSNIKTPPPMPTTPVSYQSSRNNVNGHITNGHTTNGHTTNGHTTNGHSNGHGTKGHNHIVADEEINMSPQKASSPLAAKTNGNASANGISRNNKIEQVTKQIENGSKLEYRETAID